ncbi:MAG: hypothetical protein AB7Y46_04350 [Armatimonadota bacterium]
MGASQEDETRLTTLGLMGVLAVAPCFAQDAPELVLRNPHYFVVLGDGRSGPTITMTCRGFFTYATGLTAVVTDPEGRVRLRASVPVDQTLQRQIPGEPADLYLVSAEMGSNGVIFSSDRPWAVYAGGPVGVGSNGPVPEMYVYVPEATERFTLRVWANSPNEGGRVTLHYPDGAEALVMDGEFDAEEAREVPVSPEGRGAVWSLTWDQPQTVEAHLEDINVFVDGDLTPLLWIAREWAEQFGEALWQRHRAALAKEGVQ